MSNNNKKYDMRFSLTINEMYILKESLYTAHFNNPCDKTTDYGIGDGESFFEVAKLRTCDCCQCATNLIRRNLFDKVEKKMLKVTSSK